nr:F-box/LRR-repeat protein 15-like isoform X1 [Dermatophagoides farinae]
MMTLSQQQQQQQQTLMTSGTSMAIKSTTSTASSSSANIPSQQQQQRRPSRNGPPPKAPPKTQRARLKNYLLNLRKPATLSELFLNVEFLRKHFFPKYYHHLSLSSSNNSIAEFCRLSQVCKTWCHILYMDSHYWQDLIFTIHYGELRQMEKSQQEQLNNNNNDDDDVEQSAKLFKCPTNTTNGFADVNSMTKMNDNGKKSTTINKSDAFLLLNYSSLINADDQNGNNNSQSEMVDTKSNDDDDNNSMIITKTTVATTTTTTKMINPQRKRLYYSIKLRQFQTICLQNPSDNDLVELVNFYKNFHHPNEDNNNNLNLNPMNSSLSTSSSSSSSSSNTNEKQSINLNHIIIRNGTITDNGLEILLTTFAKTLNSFELIGCNELSNSGLWSGLVPNLRLLTIQDCINISDDTVTILCQLLTSLQTFQFQAYHVTDIAMAYFSTSLMRQSLRVLTLQHCWEITNQGVANVAHSLPNLTSLSLSGCSKVTDDAIEVVAEQLRNLTQLDLSWCPRISDAALEFIACDLADTLQTLVLDRCLHVTDIGLGYLATMANLTHLSVRWCPQIRDFGLQALTSLRSLRTLSIAGCSHVTITGMSFITRMRQLEEIELTNCPAATKDLLKYLAESLPESCTIIT